MPHALSQAPSEIKELHRQNAWLTAQEEAFRAAISGAGLEQSLGILVRTAVKQTEGASRCGFWMADDTRTGLHHVVGLAEDYARRIDGFRIGADSLACGLAVGTSKPVITPDIYDEPRWQSWRWLADEYGYRGVWSFPVQIEADYSIGTFAMYFSEPREPTARELELAGVMTHAGAIIISCHKRAHESTFLAEQRNLLSKELQHRVNEMVATIRTTASHTLSGAQSLKHFYESFDGRLGAIASAQRLLIHGNMDEASLWELISQEVKACGRLVENITIEGPEVRLRPKAAHVLAVVVHEMAINALRHGALSPAAPRGRIAVQWVVEPAGEPEGPPRLLLRWTESEVPHVNLNAARRGGCDLIEQAFRHEFREAETRLEFREGGARFSLEIPLRPDVVGVVRI
jgi:two-component sensor histidine kinase